MESMQRLNVLKHGLQAIMGLHAELCSFTCPENGCRKAKCL